MKKKPASKSSSKATPKMKRRHVEARDDDNQHKHAARVTIEARKHERRREDDDDRDKKRRDDDESEKRRRDDDDREHHEHRHISAGERVEIDIDVDVHCHPCEPGGGGAGGGGTGRGGGGGAGGGGAGGGGTGGRPVHTTGTSDGSLNGQQPTIGDVVRLVGNGVRPNGPWPGPRKDLVLPYLFMRANPGDTGTRPVVGPFWESPDIFVLPGVAPNSAPAIPATLGGVAKAGVDNTVYAHVWNFGLAPAYEVIVEFYWFNPTLGFNQASSNLIGLQTTHLGARGSSTSHKVVKCPESWPATYVNGGHECLVVRIRDLAADPLSNPEWDASQNRHVAQRNIHVMSAAEAAAKPTIGIEVGPLFGAAAKVQIDRANPTAMPFLHMVTMNRANTLAPGNWTGTAGITPATAAGAPIPNLGAVPDPAGAGLVAGQQTVTGDNQQVNFHTNDPAPANGQANVYRVSASQGGQTVGGYTVVIIGG